MKVVRLAWDILIGITIWHVFREHPLFRSVVIRVLEFIGHLVTVLLSNLRT